MVKLKNVHNLCQSINKCDTGASSGAIFDGGDIIPGAITTQALAPQSITTSKLAPAIITQEKLAPNVSAKLLSPENFIFKREDSEDSTPAEIDSGFLGYDAGADQFIVSVGLKGALGEQGPEGDKGIVGDQGLQGLRGLQGDPGVQGVVGDKGDTGDSGSQGPIGSQGIVGDKGSVGDKGDTGDTGSQGPVGPQGIVGDKGPVGDKGVKGVTGSIGSQGPIGSQGVVGDKGSVGDKGDTGDTGSQGPIGSQGILGDKGPVGDKGDTGDTGIQGPVGSQGIVGDKGTRGAGGGAKGDKGDIGQLGQKGDQGLQGIQGSTGLQGVKGEQGEKGDQGSQGLLGLQGLQGLQGVKGEQGEKGDQGSQGLRGLQGLQGLQGVKGEQGLAGTQGLGGEKGAQGLGGEKGAQGIPGNQGEAGDEGAQGVQGDKGDVGSQGIQGTQGLLGPAGQSGSTDVIIRDHWEFIGPTAGIGAINQSRSLGPKRAGLYVNPQSGACEDVLYVKETDTLFAVGTNSGINVARPSLSLLDAYLPVNGDGDAQDVVDPNPGPFEADLVNIKWRKVLPPESQFVSMSSVSVNVTDPKRMYVGTNRDSSYASLAHNIGAYWWSDSYGESWNLKNMQETLQNLFAAQGSNHDEHAIEMCRVVGVGDTLLIGIQDSVAGDVHNGVFRSVDHGENWNFQTFGANAQVHDIKTHATSPRTHNFAINAATKRGLGSANTHWLLGQGSTSAFTIDADFKETLVFSVGDTALFVNEVAGAHPFTLGTDSGDGFSTKDAAFDDSDPATRSITFTDDHVGLNLVYNCEFHPHMGGRVLVLPRPATVTYVSTTEGLFYSEDVGATYANVTGHNWRLDDAANTKIAYNGFLYVITAHTTTSDDFIFAADVHRTDDFFRRYGRIAMGSQSGLGSRGILEGLEANPGQLKNGIHLSTATTDGAGRGAAFTLYVTNNSIADIICHSPGGQYASGDRVILRVPDTGDVTQNVAFVLSDVMMEYMQWCGEALTIEGGGNVEGVIPRSKKSFGDPQPLALKEGVPGGQHGVHLAIEACALDLCTFYQGGDRQALGSTSNGSGVWPNSIGANGFHGRLFRSCMKSVVVEKITQWAIAVNGTDLEITLENAPRGIHDLKQRARIDGFYGSVAKVVGGGDFDPNSYFYIKSVNDRVLTLKHDNALVAGDGILLNGFVSFPDARAMSLTDVHANDPLGGARDFGAPHADCRSLFCVKLDHRKNGILIESGDGGITCRDQCESNAGGWTSLNGDIVSFEIHSMNYSETTKCAYIGLQDNGTMSNISPFTTEFRQLLGADGIDCCIIESYDNKHFGVAVNNGRNNFTLRNHANASFGNLGFSVGSGRAHLIQAYQRLGGPRILEFDTDNHIQAENTHPAIGASSFFTPQIKSSPGKKNMICYNSSTFVKIIEDVFDSASVSHVLDWEGVALNQFGLAFGTRHAPNFVLASGGSNLYSSINFEKLTLLRSTDVTGGLTYGIYIDINDRDRIVFCQSTGADAFNHWFDRSPDDQHVWYTFNGGGRQLSNESGGDQGFWYEITPTGGLRGLRRSCIVHNYVIVGNLDGLFAIDTTRINFKSQNDVTNTVNWLPIGPRSGNMVTSIVYGPNEDVLVISFWGNGVHRIDKITTRLKNLFAA